MKALTLALLTIMTTAAQAKSSTTISGKEAMADVRSSSLDPLDDFEGDGCTVVGKQRGHDLEITFTKDGGQALSFEIFEDTQYKYIDQSKGDDTKFTLSTLNGNSSLTIEQASDAFIVISASVNGVKSECEADM